MKYLRFLMYFLFIPILVSCNNEGIEEDPPFDFVRFEMDGEEFLLTDKYPTPTANTYYLIPEDNFDAIRVSMINQEYLTIINIRNTNIFSQELPYRVDGTSEPFIDGRVGIQLINQVNRVDTVFSETDTINFSGNNFEGFNIVIISTENNILRANFEGTVRTKSELSREKIISNGRLKITMDFITE